jgi:hypothetical protein
VASGRNPKFGNIKTVLMFVRSPFWEDIVAGRKRFEIRAGPRYAKLKTGDSLNLNGKLRVRISRIEECSNASEAERASIRAGYRVSAEKIADIYTEQSGLRLLHFSCCLINPCSDAQAGRIAMNMNTVHGEPSAELIAPFLSVLDDSTLKEIFLPDSLLSDIKAFDETLNLRLAELQVPDSMDTESARNIPNCVCKCGHRHVAQIMVRASVRDLAGRVNRLL